MKLLGLEEIIKKFRLDDVSEDLIIKGGQEKDEFIELLFNLFKLTSRSVENVAISAKSNIHAGRFLIEACRRYNPDKELILTRMLEALNLDRHSKIQPSVSYFERMGFISIKEIEKNQKQVILNLEKPGIKFLYELLHRFSKSDDFKANLKFTSEDKSDEKKRNL